LGTYSLICHPDTPALAVTGVRVDWEQQAGAQGDALTLHWSVTGAGAMVVPPRVAAPARRDGLWQTTCFELFLADGTGAYREINLSPAGHWAAYAFAAYRQGMAPLPLPAPEIAVAPGDPLTVTAILPGDLTQGAVSASLTAVIEEAGGHKSYWALGHPAGRPDFHAPSCFLLPLGAAQAS